MWKMLVKIYIQMDLKKCILQPNYCVTVLHGSPLTKSTLALPLTGLGSSPFCFAFCLLFGKVKCFKNLKKIICFHGNQMNQVFKSQWFFILSDSHTYPPSPCLRCA